MAEFFASLGSFFSSFFNINLLWFGLMLSALVFVHELGHYLAAIRLGVHIEEFGLGFPPRLGGVVKDKTGKLRWFLGQNSPPEKELGGPRTIYSLNWIPLGGFVRPKGEDDPLVPGGLSAASKRTRLIVLAAGSTFNIIFAFFILTFGFLTGWPEARPNEVSIQVVVADAPAALGGLQVNDVIVQLDGTPLTVLVEQLGDSADARAAVSHYISTHEGQRVNFGVQRGTELLTLPVQLRTRAETPAGQGLTGIVLGTPYDLKTYPIHEALYRAGTEIVGQFRTLMDIPGMLIRQQITWGELRPVGMVGMKAMTDMAVEMSQEAGHPFPLVQMMALISVALGITNLLPIPALDGGRILFVLIEALRGRRVDPQRETQVHLIGFAMLLLLMLVITYQDIFYPLIPR